MTLWIYALAVDDSRLFTRCRIILYWRSSVIFGCLIGASYPRTVPECAGAESNDLFLLHSCRQQQRRGYIEKHDGGGKTETLKRIIVHILHSTYAETIHPFKFRLAHFF